MRKKYILLNYKKFRILCVLTKQAFFEFIIQIISIDIKQSQ